MAINLFFKTLLTLMILGGVFSCDNNGDKVSGTITFFDRRDSQDYTAVKIGDRWWMAENLNYRSDTGSWYVNNDSASYASVFGRMYDWNTAMNAAPPGWHVPSKSEWDSLLARYDSDSAAYAYLTRTGLSDFKAQFGGYRDGGGNFKYAYHYGPYWTSTEYNPEEACYAFFNKSVKTVTMEYYSKVRGFYIRCVRD